MSRATHRLVSVFILLVLLVAVVWLSFALAASSRDRQRDAVQRQDEQVYRQCLSRNEGRADTRAMFLAFGDLLDPHHSSPQWPTFEQLLEDRLGSIDCTSREEP